MLRIRLLGSIEVTRAGEPVALTPRAVGLLTRLALSSVPVDRERILIDLWGDDVSPDRRRSLETLISNLRAAATGRDGIVFRDGSYDLTVPVDLDIRDALDICHGNNQGSSLKQAGARTALAARRGDSMVSRLGTSTWIDDLDRDVREGIESAQAMVGIAAPEVRYVTDDRHIAYQVRDGTAPTILLYGGLATHCEGIWEAPGFAEWIDAAFGEHRLIVLDKRGSGLSDPVTDVPTAADFVDDTLAVLDASETDRVIMVCGAEAGMWGPYLAADHPERVAGVVFINAIAKMFQSDDYPCGLPERIAREFGEGVRDTWARHQPDQDAGLGISAPSRAGDVAFRTWATRYQRLVASPGSIWQLARYTATGDARDQVRRIAQPTLVVQSRNSSYFRPSSARWLCDALGLGQPVWLDSADHLFWVADPQRSAAAIADFIDQIQVQSPG